MQTAIIGTGKIGEAIARKLVKAGYTVLLTNSRGAESLEEKAAELGALATASELSELSKADILFLTVRWSQIKTLAKQLPDLQGKILVDVTNPFLDDMRLDDLRGKTASEVVQEFFPGARVVKALNHYFLKWIEADPKVGDGRRIAFVSGDDTAAKKTVADLLGEFGFHPVDLGSLKVGGQLQQAGSPLAGLNVVNYPA